MSAKSELQIVIFRVKQYIPTCFETGFHKYHAAHIVCILEDFFKKSLETDGIRYSFRSGFEAKFVINICKCCIAEVFLYKHVKFHKHKNEAVLKIFERAVKYDYMKYIFVSLYNQYFPNFLESLRSRRFSSFVTEISISDLISETSSAEETQIEANAKLMCDAMVSEVKDYVDQCFGKEFHPNQATRIVKMLNDFFCPERKE